LESFEWRRGNSEGITGGEGRSDHPFPTSSIEQRRDPLMISSEPFISYDEVRPMSIRRSLCWTAIALGMTLMLGDSVLEAEEKNPYQKDPESCASCHMIAPYVETWKKSEFLDYKHAKAGVGCMDCHQVPIEKQREHVEKARSKTYDAPLREREYGNEACFSCHESYKELIEATKDFLGKELPRNPHESHYQDLDCNLCHKAHRVSVDYCSMCHHPAVNKPGWTVF
jgi:hypothetical protein